jgi:hypothetical protein
MRRLTPDYRTIAAFRHDNPEAIMLNAAAGALNFIACFGRKDAAVGQRDGR